MFLATSWRSARRTLVALSLALAGCRASLPAASPTPNTFPLRLLVDGASTPLLHELANSFYNKDALAAWDIITLEPRYALAELARGEVPFAVLSHLPDPRLVEEGALWATPIAQLGIALIVHPSNLINNLTPAQMRALLRGQVRNWAEVGGADRPVQVIARPAESSEAAIVQALLLGDQPITRTARLAPTSQSVLELVQADPNSIGYVSVGHLKEGVRTVAFDGILPTVEAITVGTYALRSPILVVGNAEPANDLYRAFFAWIQSPEGQRIVRQRYGALPMQ